MVTFITFSDIKILNIVLRWENDSGMLWYSRILKMFEGHAFNHYGEPMFLYGDPAYPLDIHLQAPFRMTLLNSNKVAFNRSMSTSSCFC